MSSDSKDSEQNRAAVLIKMGEMQVQDVDMPPTPGKNQVLIRMKKVGICGSDVH
jgi:threonine dehydrogenase-like Zn-dependent dehydrogenase